MSIEAPPPTWKRSTVLLGLPLLCFVLLQADGRFPLVRFSNDLANSVVGTLSFLLPFLTAYFAFVVPRRWLTTIVAIVSLLPLLCLSALGLLFEGVVTGDTLRTGLNPSYERIASVPMAGYSVGIYRTDCGAPCSFGIDILQEKRVLPGVLLVRALDGFDEAGDATYKVIGPDTLLINVPPYVDNDPRGVSIPARSKTFHLKPFVYF